MKKNKIVKKKDRYSSKPFYKEVAKEIQKWIKKKFPEDRERVNVDGKRKPGNQADFNDKELMEIALEVKVELKGEQVNYLKLQEITGIGRNTWSRRIPDYIKELNSPAVDLRDRNIELYEHDEINHTNIALIVERYGNNPRELINHLYYLEESRISYYDQAKKMKEENQRLLKYEEVNEKLLKENKKLKEELAYYIYISDNLSVSSFFPELRKCTGAKEGTIELKSNPEKNTNILNLSQLFPSTREIAATNKIIDEVIMEGNPHRAGEEFVNDVNDKYGKLFNDYE
jgi:hypothetical protein